jgi:hypothetical protein
MKAIRFALGSFLFVAFLSSASNGQTGTSPRTFVSGTAPFGNSCSRLAPCRTFVEALTQTAPGGEVVVLDSAGYGPVTISHGVSIIAPQGLFAGISVFSGDGIDINAGASDTVILRGLTVTNQGSTGNGVVFNTGLRLHVEGCVIDGFSNPLSTGLSLLAGGFAQVEVIDSIVRDNGTGILVLPSSGTEEATIDHVRLEANERALDAREGSQVTVSNSVAANNAVGLLAFSHTSGSVQMNVESTVASGNSGPGIAADSEVTGAVQVNVARCVISSNGSGISSQSVSTGVPTVRVSSSTVTGNIVGLINVGSPALILSRGDNTVEGNNTDTHGTIGSYTAK